jgi:hypothetical protein
MLETIGQPILESVNELKQYYNKSLNKIREATKSNKKSGIFMNKSMEMSSAIILAEDILDAIGRKAKNMDYKEIIPQDDDSFGPWIQTDDIDNKQLEFRFVKNSPRFDHNGQQFRDEFMGDTNLKIRDATNIAIKIIRDCMSNSDLEDFVLQLGNSITMDFHDHSAYSKLTKNVQINGLKLPKNITIDIKIDKDSE